MVQFVDDLTLHLETLGHGSISGKTLRKGRLTDTPRDVIVVNDTGGIPNILNRKGANVELIAIQVLARNKRQEIARDKLLAIQDDLHRAYNVRLDNFTIIQSVAAERPAIIQRNTDKAKESWTLVSNYEISVKPN